MGGNANANASAAAVEEKPVVAKAPAVAAIADLKVGDTFVDGAFEVIAVEEVDEYNVACAELIHKKTGARWMHCGADDDNNVFNVAFRTTPTDSTGVAHILEHTALCGSERYPIRDPFFNMLRRSLSTFMNAMTASDYTCYPFATLNTVDYYNLLGVYLDAAFFPKLTREDFLQARSIDYRTGSHTTALAS
jgi:Zn-dependent M16 (insulinase) family peptidase